eukprot:606209-Prorocentrum_minimum.AAC.1
MVLSPRWQPRVCPALMAAVGSVRLILGWKEHSSSARSSGLGVSLARAARAAFRARFASTA